MPPQSSGTQPAKALVNRLSGGQTTRRNVRALVLSSELEVRKPLLRALEAVGADVICSSGAQAEEAPSKQACRAIGLCTTRENLPSCDKSLQRDF